MMNLRPKLLVVDDHADLRITLKDILEDEGFVVELASSGEEALEWVRRNRVDGIVSDVEMPDGDGVELLKRLRLSGNETPFFMMTGGVLIDRVEAVRLGATEFFTKPDEIEHLRERVRQFFFHR